MRAGPVVREDGADMRATRPLRPLTMTITAPLVRTARRMLPVVVLPLLLILSGCTGLAESNPSVRRGPAPPATTPIPASAFQIGDPFVAALRTGGYVLLLHHAQSRTDDGQDPGTATECDGETSLSDEGAQAARTVGEAVRRLDVPVGTVLAAPDCRARDTAWLAFDKAEPDDRLAAPVSTGEGQDQLQDLRDLVGTVPSAETNTTLVVGPELIDAAFGEPSQPGEMLVYQPGDEGGDPVLLRRLSPGDWTELARGAGSVPRSGQVPSLREFDVDEGARPFGVLPDPAGGAVWYTAEGSGQLGRLDPGTGRSEMVDLGPGSAPRDLTFAPDGFIWIADPGQGAIVRYGPRSRTLDSFPLPAARADVGLTGVTVDDRGMVWFTGVNGIFGRFDPSAGRMEVYDAPEGRGPSGITTTSKGAVFYASFDGGYIAEIDVVEASAETFEPPSRSQGARRMSSDGQGRVWFTEWSAGQVGVHDPTSGGWREWRLPGGQPRPYALHVDRAGQVWVSDESANTILRLDPVTGRFVDVTLPGPNAVVRDLAGRDGEVWATQSGVDRLALLT